MHSHTFYFHTYIFTDDVECLTSNYRGNVNLYRYKFFAISRLGHMIPQNNHRVQEKKCLRSQRTLCDTKTKDLLEVLNHFFITAFK